MTSHTTDLATTGTTDVISAPQPSAQLIALSDDAMRRLDTEMAFMDRLYRYAKQLCSSEFVPDIYRGKPENGAAAMQYGATLGLSGMAALQNVFLVKGKPSTYARVMYAAAIAAGHEMWEEPGASADGVTWHGRRRGEDKLFSTTWDLARVKQAGYDSNSKYKTNPVEMLRAKCQAEVARYIASDILAGMPYSSEELDLEPHRIPSIRVRQGGGGVGALRERLMPKITVKPPERGTDERQPAAVADADAMSETTRKKWQDRLFALLAEGDCTDRDDLLIVLQAVAPHPEPRSSRGELSDPELRTAVEQLNAWSKTGELGAQIAEILNAATLASADEA